MVTMIIGGARSGKSEFALKQAYGDSLHSHAFIATAEANDAEMRERIERHRQQRSADWVTFEAPLELASLLRETALKFDRILVDCLTLWLSNQMLAIPDHLDHAIEGLLWAIEESRKHSQLFLVTNEVGMGIVPEIPLARQFRDVSGFLNQKIAEIADDVWLVTAGIPLKIKQRGIHVTHF
jgi:adenosylcobinamide kinase/adenosylcobinamide-phosphate guanylyltransferase